MSKRAIANPQMWNRYTYALNNPLKYVDPTGKDVSIGISFTGDWTDEQKKRVIADVTKLYRGMNVGAVYVFDTAKFKQGGGLFSRLFGGGRANIEATSKTGDLNTPTKVFAGNFLQDPNLSDAQKAQAIANAIGHETFTHRFPIFGGESRDRVIFDRDSGWGNFDWVRDRYGTIVDSNVAVDPSTRPRLFSGPLPVYGEDRANAQRVLGAISIPPPEPED